MHPYDNKVKNLWRKPKEKKNIQNDLQGHQGLKVLECNPSINIVSVKRPFFEQEN